MEYQSNDEHSTTGVTTLAGAELPSQSNSTNKGHQYATKKPTSGIRLLSLLSTSSRPSFSKKSSSSHNESISEKQAILLRPSFDSSMRYSTRNMFSRFSRFMAAASGTSHNRALLESSVQTAKSRVAVSALGASFNDKRNLHQEMYRCAYYGDAERMEVVLQTKHANVNSRQLAKARLAVNEAVHIPRTDKIARMTVLEVAGYRSHTDVVEVLLASGMLSRESLQAAARNFRPKILFDVRQGSIDRLSLYLVVGAIAGDLDRNESKLLVSTAIEKGGTGLDHLFKTTSLLRDIAYRCSKLNMPRDCKQDDFKEKISDALLGHVDNHMWRLLSDGIHVQCKALLNNALLLMVMLTQHDDTNFCLHELLRLLETRINAIHST